MPEFKTQEALVLSTRPLGERSYILSLFTQEHGKHLGVIRCKTPPDIASFVHTRWQARLPEQMGRYYLEDSYSFAAAFLEDKKRLACLSCICTLLDKLLPERQNNLFLYQQTFFFLKTQLEQETFIENYIRWEIELLSVLGFGLDLTTCAGGGDSHNLCYVSPKTGRSVSAEKGAPYHKKLLNLPPFLWKNTPATPSDLKQGLNLTAFFLIHHTGLTQLPLLRDCL